MPDPTLPMADLPVAQPRVVKRSGWPKGKPRGPQRKTRTYRKAATGAEPKRPTRVEQVRKIKESLAMVVVVGDSLAASVSPAWADPNMRLKGAEAWSLADALGDEIMTNERAANFLLRVVEKNAHIKIVAVVLGIAIPRLAYKGILPREIANAVAAPGQPAAQEFAPPVPPDTAPEPQRGGDDAPTFPLEGGGAHGDNGGHGVREIDLGGRTIDIAEVRPDLPEQTGPSGVRGRRKPAEGGRNVEPPIPAHRVGATV